MAAKSRRTSRIRSNKSRLICAVLIYALGVSLVVGLLAAYFVSTIFFKPNIRVPGAKEAAFYIPTGSTYSMVLQSLRDQDLLKNSKSFDWLARRKEYHSRVKAGKYILRDGMNNLQLVDMLRAGKQVPVKLIFNNIRTPEQLAGKVSRQIEADSASIIRLLRDKDYLGRLGFSPPEALALFVPNTYEFFWNTSAQGFIERMHKEHHAFWNETRRAKLARSGLDISKVVTLASIVEKETNHDPEKPRIAGVYINRLKKGWLLQADPTVVFASGDFALRRVLKVHTAIKSPYNTYLHRGLPPGPICIPSIASVEAVLDYESHDYMYFCAKPGNSGSHAFAKTLAQHNANAAAYHRSLRHPSGSF